VESADHATLARFLSENESAVADDHSGAPVFLARNAWHLETAEKEWPALEFLKVREYS
jgi:peptide chain release factor 3